jgi:ADP-ribose pyrophosphatase YjhB (NUDIX family)
LPNRAKQETVSVSIYIEHPFKDGRKRSNAGGVEGSGGRVPLMETHNAEGPDGVAKLERRVARDREEFAVHSNGGDWLTAWHPEGEAPPGTPHGANGLSVTADDRVVLISNDALRWGWPGGRPEGDESWEQTLRREILEEACCIVRDARLLGFCRSACLAGPERGLVLVRSIWRAEVDLMPWEPRFEIAHRRVVPASKLLSSLWMEDGFEPIYYRALREAGLWGTHA